MVDFFDKIYSLQSNNRFLIVIRFFSLLRYVIKYIANFIIPIYYIITRDFHHISSNSVKKESKRIIVSLTSFPNRIDRLWIVIESLMRQNYKPDLIVLWLSKDQFNSINDLPKRLLKQRENGLEISLCENDLKSHKKYFYALNQYPDDVIVTFDDDVIYSSTVLSTLIKLSKKFPFSIICNEGRRITIGEDGIMPYGKWEQLYKFSEPSYNISFIGVGGVLYPPGSLHKETMNNDVFQNICISADDLWLKTMSLLEKTTVVKSDYLSNYLPLIHFNNKTLSSSNLTLNRNDQQLKEIRSHYIQKFGIDPFNQVKNLV